MRCILRFLLLACGFIAVAAIGAGTAWAKSATVQVNLRIPDSKAQVRHFQNAIFLLNYKDLLTDPQNVIITEIQRGVRNPNRIAECYQAQGGRCDIKKSVSIQASVNSSVGVSFQAVNTALGNTYSETFTTEVTCSKELAPRQFLRAYPSGDFVFFEVSGTKGTAFLPTGIQCQVENR